LSADPLFDASGEIRADITFTQLAKFVWFMETGAGAGEEGETPSLPILGIHHGKAVCLLFNGILKDKSDLGGNVLNRRTLAYLRQCLPGDGGAPLVVYGARTRFDDVSLRKLGVTFNQLPYSLKVKTWL
jgi:adenine-specific DNA-methyltransferase